MAGFNATAEVQTQNVINVIIFCLIILPAIINVAWNHYFAKGYPLTKENWRSRQEFCRKDIPQTKQNKIDSWIPVICMGMAGNVV